MEVKPEPKQNLINKIIVTNVTDTKNVELDF